MSVFIFRKLQSIMLSQKGRKWKTNLLSFSQKINTKRELRTKDKRCFILAEQNSL